MLDAVGVGVGMSQIGRSASADWVARNNASFSFEVGTRTPHSKLNSYYYKCGMRAFRRLGHRSRPCPAPY
jgi:hypothetical protein